MNLTELNEINITYWTQTKHNELDWTQWTWLNNELKLNSINYTELNELE